MYVEVSIPIALFKTFTYIVPQKYTKQIFPGQSVFIPFNKKINYKEYKFLRKFITDQGKIIPAHVTGVSAKYQRMLTREIKKARILALLRFVVGPRQN